MAKPGLTKPTLIKIKNQDPKIETNKALIELIYNPIVAQI
jgi:hypothetical protein